MEQNILENYFDLSTDTDKNSNHGISNKNISVSQAPDSSIFF